MHAQKILQILEKDMNRQDFLKMAGLVALGIIGLPQLLSLLHGSSNVSSRKTSQSGYGSSPYGA